MLLVLGLGEGEASGRLSVALPELNLRIGSGRPESGDGLLVPYLVI